MGRQQQSLDPFWIILTGAWKAVRFSFDAGHTSTMNFRVYAVAQARDGNWLIQGGRDGCGDFDPLDMWAECFAQISGAIKWDGCINWETNPDVMMHGCGPHHVRELNEIFAAVFHVAKRFNDLLGDEAPELPEDAIEVPG